MIFTKKSTKEMVQGEAEVKKEKPIKRWKLGKHGQERKKKDRPLDGSTPLYRTKVFWGVACMLLGLLIAFVGIPMVKSAVSETEETVCFAQDVKAGTKITAELLTTTDMSLYHLPLGVVHDVQAAIGQYVKTDAVAGDLVTQSRLSAAYPGQDPQLAGLPSGMVAISISLPDLAQSVSGKLRQGDVIQLFAVEDNASFTAVAPPELQYVEVLAATYVDGTEVQDKQNGVDHAEPGGNDTLTTVTLLANGQQAACLAGLEHNATLHAALVVRGDDHAKTTALKAQADYFTPLEVPEERTSPEEGTAPTTQSVTPPAAPNAQNG